VMACRQLREEFEVCLDARGEQAESPFLRAQILQEVGPLLDVLERVQGLAGRARRERKASFLKSLFTLEEPTAQEAKSFGLEGSSASIPLTEMIGFLSNSGRTGVLFVNTPDEAFTIEFNAGEMTRALSDKTPKGLRLGEILVDQGALSAEQVDTLVNEARQTGTYFGKFLLDQGHLKPEQLRAAFAVQVQSLFHRLNSSKDALYRFQEDVNMSDAQDLNLSVTGLLLECARVDDEAERRSDSRESA